MRRNHHSINGLSHAASVILDNIQSSGGGGGERALFGHGPTEHSLGCLHYVIGIDAYNDVWLANMFTTVYKPERRYVCHLSVWV